MGKEPSKIAVFVATVMIGIPLVILVFSIMSLLAMLSWNHLVNTLFIGYPEVDFIQSCCILFIASVFGRCLGFLRFSSSKGE
jgi:hypothetical protein